MNYLKHLSADELHKLEVAPAWFIIYAVLKEGELEDCNVREAIDIVHIRTFSASDILKDYYRFIDKNFEKNLEKEIDKLPDTCLRKIATVKAHIESLKYIFKKLDPEFAIALIDSFYSLSKHVVMTGKSPLEGLRFFIFPDSLENEY